MGLFKWALVRYISADGDGLAMPIWADEHAQRARSHTRLRSHVCFLLLFCCCWYVDSQSPLHRERKVVLFVPRNEIKGSMQIVPLKMLPGRNKNEKKSSAHTQNTKRKSQFTHPFDLIFSVGLPFNCNSANPYARAQHTRTQQLFRSVPPCATLQIEIVHCVLA